jgi:hypothetical protein
MKSYTLTLLIAALIPIAIEDFRFRKISLYWLIAIAGIAIFVQLNSTISKTEILTNTLINFIIIIVNYVCITAYFSIKKMQRVNLTKQHLGLGDIAFLFSLAFLFSPLNFILFLVSSLLFTLLFIIILNIFFTQKYTTIPLAGIQSCFLSFSLLFLFAVCKKWLVNDDSLILNAILKYAGKV